jgi:hypothetical protein
MVCTACVETVTSALRLVSVSEMMYSECVQPAQGLRPIQISNGLGLRLFENRCEISRGVLLTPPTKP